MARLAGQQERDALGDARTRTERGGAGFTARAQACGRAGVDAARPAAERAARKQGAARRAVEEEA